MSKEHNPVVELYIKSLKAHDWFYEYSDDHRVWTRGKDQRRIILNLREQCDPDSEIWNEHCPDHFMVKHEGS